MKSGWWRVAPVGLANPAAAGRPTTVAAGEDVMASRAGSIDQLLGTSLRLELRMLCCGLVRCRWCDTLRAVVTDVHLPADEAHELALRALCWELADEFGIEQLVRRQGEAWIVRFSRRENRCGGDGGRR